MLKLFKRLLLVAAAVLLATSICSARFYIDIPGDNWDGSISVRLSNTYGEPITNLYLGFEISSTDGAAYTTIDASWEPGIDAYFDAALGVDMSGVDGVMPDSLGFYGSAMMQPGVPNGYDDVILTMALTFDPSMAGKTVRIDKIPDQWLAWVSEGFVEAPDWGGPYFFEIPAEAGMGVSISGPGAGDGDTIICEQPVTFDVRAWNASSDTIKATQNAFKIYSPNGAGWEAPSFSSTASFESCFDAIMIGGLSVTGTGADTIYLVGTAMTAPGMPNGYDDVILRIETEAYEGRSDGDTLCIDSSFYQPSGTWMWMNQDMQTVIPSWGGPYCYKLMCVTQGSICGRKFNDVNGNGVDDSDPGILNWWIELVDATGTVVQTVQTDPNGDYCFNNVSMGNYTVREQQQGGYKQTFPTLVEYKVYMPPLNLPGWYIPDLDFGNYMCEWETTWDTCEVGVRDDFTAPGEPSDPHPDLLAVMNSCSGGGRPYTDDATYDRCFGHSYDSCWYDTCPVVSAQLCLRVKALNNSLTINDRLYIGNWSEGGAIWSIALKDLYAWYTSGPATWFYGNEMETCLDLANLPAAGVGPSNILSFVRGKRVDILIQDDTDIDYMDLFVELCCPPDDTLGSIEGFKFEDVNGNSVYEQGPEGPLEDVTIKLHGSLDAGGTTDLFTTTDAFGEYSFYGLEPGDYWVSEDPGTYYQTYPLTVMHTVPDLQYNDHLTGYDFGNDTICIEIQSAETCLHGTDDGFDGPEPSNMSQGLHDWIVANTIPGSILTNFDQPASDQWFGHTFDGCWDDDCVVMAATMRIKLRACSGQTSTDVLYLGDYSQGPSVNGRIWGIGMNALVSLATGGADTQWDNGDVLDYTLDLANLPPNGWRPTNLLGALQDGSLDIVVADETEVDFIEIHVELCCPEPCYADGDANGDDIVLSVADLVYLINFIDACGPAPVPLYSCDLNGDGYVNVDDAQVYYDYFIDGISVFDPYGGYPVECPCDPIGQPVPDTVLIFGLEHCSEGYACLEEVDNNLVVSRLMAAPAPEGIVVDIPDAISAPSSKCVIWQGEFDDPDAGDALPVGASYGFEAYGTLDDVPDQYLGALVSTKTATDVWEMSADLTGASSYTVAAYNDGVQVFYQEGLTPTERFHIKIGRYDIFVENPFKTKFIRIYKDVLKPGIDWREPNNWNWPEQGVADLAVDCIEIIGEGITTEFGGLSEVRLISENIPTYTIETESYAIDYKDVVISNLGNAVMTPDDTTLIVSNLGSSGLDGVSCEPEDGDYPDDLIYRSEITMENPDHDGTFPVGAGIRALYEFAVAGQEDFQAELSFNFCGAGLWLLGTQSMTGWGSVEAYNDDTLVFSIESVSVGSLGLIVETTKGVHPVGFRGGSTGKPASIIAVQDAEWSWDAHGVFELTVDEIHVYYDAFYPPIGITSFSIRGRSVAKGDPISFTILDMQVEGGCCEIRGDIDHNGTEQPDIADLVYLVTFMFQEGPEPPCMEETDVDGNGTEVPDIADLVYLVTYMFQDGPALIPCGQSSGKVAARASDPEVSIDAVFDGVSTLISLSSEADLLGLQMTLEGSVEEHPVQLCDSRLEVIYGGRGNTMNVGVLDLEGAAVIPMGETRILRLAGEYRILTALAADTDLRSLEPTIGAASRVAGMPEQFELGQNYPNPFNPVTQIQFALPVASDIRLDIFNVLGQTVTTLYDGPAEAGHHTLSWDASAAASGIYFYRLTAGQYVESRKMMLLK